MRIDKGSYLFPSCHFLFIIYSIKMEVGIEDCLHIEFEYNKSKYHLKDVIVGKIYFLLVRIKIKHMELAIIKRETTGSGKGNLALTLVPMVPYAL